MDEVCALIHLIMEFAKGKMLKSRTRKKRRIFLQVLQVKLFGKAKLIRGVARLKVIAYITNEGTGIEHEYSQS